MAGKDAYRRNILRITLAVKYFKVGHEFLIDAMSQIANGHVKAAVRLEQQFDAGNIDYRPRAGRHEILDTRSQIINLTRNTTHYLSLVEAWLQEGRIYFLITGENSRITRIVLEFSRATVSVEFRLWPQEKPPDCNQSFEISHRLFPFKFKWYQVLRISYS